MEGGTNSIMLPGRKWKFAFGLCEIFGILVVRSDEQFLGIGRHLLYMLVDLVVAIGAVWNG